MFNHYVNCVSFNHRGITVELGDLVSMGSVLLGDKKVGVFVSGIIHEKLVKLMSGAEKRIIVNAHFNFFVEGILKEISLNEMAHEPDIYVIERFSNAQ